MLVLTFIIIYVFIGIIFALYFNKFLLPMVAECDSEIKEFVSNKSNKNLFLTICALTWISIIIKVGFAKRR